MQVGQQLVDVEVNDAEGLVVDGNTLITVIKVPPTLTASGERNRRTEGRLTYTLNPSSPKEADPKITTEVIESWDVNWGDGTTSHYSIIPAAANSSISPTHVYADNGTYKITETATDGDGGSPTRTTRLSVNVLNVAPVLQNVAVTVTSPINENGFTDLSGRIVDPGIKDNFTLTVNWGDGTRCQSADMRHLITVRRGNAELRRFAPIPRPGFDRGQQESGQLHDLDLRHRQGRRREPAGYGKCL